MPIKRRTLRKIRKSKKKCEEIHAIKRCGQRFNIDLTPKQLRTITQGIGGKNSKFIKRLSLRVTAWQTNINGNDMIALYDTKRHTIVTFLPPDYEI